MLNEKNAPKVNKGMEKVIPLGAEISSAMAQPGYCDCYCPPQSSYYDTPYVSGYLIPGGGCDCYCGGGAVDSLFNGKWSIPQS